MLKPFLMAAMLLTSCLFSIKQTIPASECIPGVVYHIWYSTSNSKEEIDTNANEFVLTTTIEAGTIVLTVTPESELGIGPTWTESICEY